MKRKLNEQDVPMPLTDTATPTSPNISFQTLGLDSRLLQAISREAFTHPTPVQSQVIPLALEGKDILARAKTGSGKTAAYILPILEAILRKKTIKPDIKAVSALILVPTRELASQVSHALTIFSAFCANEIKTINLTQKVSDDVQRALLADSPDVVVATPARAFLNLNNSALSLEKLSQLVVDEADLVLSYGYEEDLQNIAKALPTGVQTMLMSATLSTEVEALKGLFLKDAVVLALDETKHDTNNVSQYVIKCGEDEKFLLIYVMFKLKLIKGKCIVFVGDIDRCYRLKLYLEQFGTRSCVLNSELPVNSRIHVVEEFNKNVYDIIIASDEQEVLGSDVHQNKNSTSEAEELPKSVDVGGQKDAEDAQVNGEARGDDTAFSVIKENTESKASVEPPKKKRKPVNKDKEYGISRGIDFKNVACVINFDFPTTSKSYIHRIGRTARAGRSGMALSFVVPSNLYRKHKPTTFPTAANDEAVLAKVTAHQAKVGHDVQPYHFDMAQVDAFRYRMNDALRAVTRLAIREARTRELRQELIKSEKLKRHFEENPDDLRHLRHDGELRAARIQPHLKHVPDYLMPGAAKNGNVVGKEIGFVGIAKPEGNRIRRARMAKKMGRGGKKVAGARRDPLKTFSAKVRK